MSTHCTRESYEGCFTSTVLSDFPYICSFFMSPADNNQVKRQTHIFSKFEARICWPNSPNDNLYANAIYVYATSHDRHCERIGGWHVMRYLAGFFQPSLSTVPLVICCFDNMTRSISISLSYTGMNDLSFNTLSHFLLISLPCSS